ncbi:hypothetical protein [Alloyangia pacifica]|uniref:Uracil-DNA glycosylase-like domain-containing protein n=1 Tax=Alloyangia pacifica TaxID=311180 RepID=A0A1I6QL31_9RHOB|nr:hypothetical protein [Alloyangia pacifica]SDF92253.1 hypothetical protein SAMN04488245_101143 [Alloyangia pacifica]SFS53151.1 hypothetical protein SAMN04488050_102144 [Alloyangia pacifica]
MDKYVLGGNLDADILFNWAPWGELVETQAELFDVAILKEISDRLQMEFHRGHAPGRDMPEIPRNAWSTKLLDRYSHKTIGYDLPCLLSAARPSRGRIMLCAQDPKRDGSESKLTVGTFFGIDSDYHRVRRHWGMMWQLIRRCVLAGYDVWVTDAIKVYAGTNVLRRDPELRALCFSVIRKEVNAFRPDRILAIGNDARDALQAADISSPVTHVVHPTARGLKGPLSERLELYWGALGGSELVS